MKFLFLTFTLLFPSLLFASSDLITLSKSEQWLRFLHYDHNWIYPTSEADGSAFFVSPEGKSNPLKELEATINGIESNDPITETSVLCRFPARSRWLKEVLHLDKKFFQFDKCTRYQEFVSEHLTNNVFYVFSSYYLESPASAFGHTMIRLGNTDKLGFSKQNELLDTGISYAANSRMENAFVYAFMGMVGGYPGIYSSIPYFYKVREYNDFESRDLWSYELNLTKEQKQKLLDHLWELGQTYFDYYYFSENCAYNLLTLLDAVNPDWKLRSKIPYYAIPIDSVRAIVKTPNLVKNVTFRPSIKKIFEKSFSKLSDQEKNELLVAFDHKKFSYLANLSDDRKVVWSDALIDLVDYKYAKEVMLEKGPYYEWKKTLLNERSKLGINPDPSYEKIEQGDSPDSGHGTSRLETGMGIRDKNFLSGILNFRFAMHDLLDPAIGQPTLASLNFFEFSFRYNLEKHGEERRTPLQLAYAKIFDIATLNPWTEYHHPLSLLAEIGVKRFDSCHETSKSFGCMTPYFEGGMGITKAKKTGSLSFLGKTDINYSSRNKNNFRLGAGPNIIGILRPSDSFAFGLNFFWARDFANQKDYYRHQAETRYYFNEKAGIKVSNQYLDKYWQHDLSLLYYF